MTNTTIAPHLSLFVVVRPLSNHVLDETYAAAVPAGTDPVTIAKDLATNVALWEPMTHVCWRTVAATDAGAARLQWPQATKSTGGRFTTGR